MMMILRVIILIALAAISFCGQDYDSILNAAKDGTLSRKLTRTLANKVFPNGQMLLHIASFSGDKNLMTKIRPLMHRFDQKINFLDRNGMSPLCLAANRETEGVEVVKYLLHNGADANQVCAEQNAVSSDDEDLMTVGKYTPFLLAVNSTFLGTASELKRGYARIEAASSNLQEEIAKETEEYIELQKQLLEKRVELGSIDLDLETVETLKKLVRENTFVLEEMNKMGEDQHGWSSIAVGLSTMLDLGLITKQEVATEQFKFLPVDIKVMKDGTSSIIRDVSSMKIRFET